MLELTGHGGSCCGVTHVWDFDDDNYEDYEFIDKLEEIHKEYKNLGSLLEIILNEYQINRLPMTVDKLQEIGFQRVTSFVNGNSGNVCHVFHWVTNGGVVKNSDIPNQIK